MHQKYKKFDRGERLIQYAIEIFDLVEIAPDASAGRSINQLLQSNILPATPYAETRNLSSRIGSKQ